MQQTYMQIIKYCKYCAIQTIMQTVTAASPHWSYPWFRGLRSKNARYGHGNVQKTTTCQCEYIPDSTVVHYVWNTGSLISLLFGYLAVVSSSCSLRDAFDTKDPMHTESRNPESHVLQETVIGKHSVWGRSQWHSHNRRCRMWGLHLAVWLPVRLPAQAAVQRGNHDDGQMEANTDEYMTSGWPGRTPEHIQEILRNISKTIQKLNVWINNTTKCWFKPASAIPGLSQPEWPVWRSSSCISYKKDSTKHPSQTSSPNTKNKPSWKRGYDIKTSKPNIYYVLEPLQNDVMPSFPARDMLLIVMLYQVSWFTLLKPQFTSCLLRPVAGGIMREINDGVRDKPPRQTEWQSAYCVQCTDCVQVMLIIQTHE